MKLILALGLLSILIALGMAVYWLLGKSSAPTQEPKAQAQRAEKMARALAWRLGLSIALVLLVLLAYALGWIQPQAAPLGR